MIGAGAGATFGFVGGLISGKGLKGALNDAAQGFGTGAFSGAISGGIAGGLGVGAGAQRAIRTLGDTIGDLGGRALDGEEITAGDAVLALGINAGFNYGLPKVFNKVKNTKFGQAVSGKISNVKDVIKGKVGNAASAVKDKVAGALSSFNKGNSKLPMEYNLQYFAERNAGNSKPLIPTNLQNFASEGGSNQLLPEITPTRRELAKQKLAEAASGINNKTIDSRTNMEIGRFIGDDRGNVFIEPVGGTTVPAGRNGVDTHTLYPNGSNYNRYNPVGHGNNTTPHGHGHLMGTGPGRRGQGPSIDVLGDVVPFNSPDAHWTIH